MDGLKKEEAAVAQSHLDYSRWQGQRGDKETLGTANGPTWNCLGLASGEPAPGTVHPGTLDPEMRL